MVKVMLPRSIEPCIVIFTIDWTERTSFICLTMQERLQGSAILHLVPLHTSTVGFFFPSHRDKVLVVPFLLDLGKDLVDWFFEDHVDSLPPSFALFRTLFASFV